MANHLSDKTRSNFNIYKKYELESTFIEINPTKSNVIIGGINRYPKMDAIDSKNNLNNLLKKPNQEQETVFLLGGFHNDLIHCNGHKPRTEFLYSLVSYLPYIVQPSQHTIIPEPLLTTFPVMSSQKTLILVILQLHYMTI